MNNLVLQMEESPRRCVTPATLWRQQPVVSSSAAKFRQGAIWRLQRHDRRPLPPASAASQAGRRSSVCRALAPHCIWQQGAAVQPHLQAAEGRGKGSCHARQGYDLGLGGGYTGATTRGGHRRYRVLTK